MDKTEAMLEMLGERISKLEEQQKQSVPKHRVQDKTFNSIKRNPDNIRASELEEDEINIVTNPNDDRVYVVIRSNNTIKKTEFT